MRHFRLIAAVLLMGALALPAQQASQDEPIFGGETLAGVKKVHVSVTLDAGDSGASHREIHDRFQLALMRGGIESVAVSEYDIMAMSEVVDRSLPSEIFVVVRCQSLYATPYRAHINKVIVEVIEFAHTNRHPRQVSVVITYHDEVVGLTSSASGAKSMLYEYASTAAETFVKAHKLNN